MLYVWPTSQVMPAVLTIYLTQLDYLQRHPASTGITLDPWPMSKV